MSFVVFLHSTIIHLGSCNDDRALVVQEESLKGVIFETVCKHFVAANRWLR